MGSCCGSCGSGGGAANTKRGLSFGVVRSVSTSSFLYSLCSYDCFFGFLHLLLCFFLHFLLCTPLGHNLIQFQVHLAIAASSVVEVIKGWSSLQGRSPSSSSVVVVIVVVAAVVVPVLVSLPPSWSLGKWVKSGQDETCCDRGENPRNVEDWLRRCLDQGEEDTREKQDHKSLKGNRVRA